MALTQRDHTIDILKGWAILLVVLGHLQQTPLIFNIWIYSFHLPLFFFCSGLLLAPERSASFRDYLLARVRGIVLPYLSLAAFAWLMAKVWDLVLIVLHQAPEIWNWDLDYLLVALVLNRRLHWFYQDMWFVNTLFLAEVAFYFIGRWSKGRWTVLAPLSFGFALLQAFVCRFAEGGVWSVDLVPSCLCFLCLGYLLRQVGPGLKEKAKVWQLPVAFGLNVGFALLNFALSGERVDLYFDKVGNPVCFYLAACAGIWAAYVAAVWMGSMRITEFFGRNSLIVYALQQKLAIRVGEEGASWLYDHSSLAADQAFQLLFTFVVAILVSAGMIAFVHRFCPWLLWRKKRKT